MSDLTGQDRVLKPAGTASHEADSSAQAAPRRYGRRALMLGAAATGAGVAASLAGGGLADAAGAGPADPAAPTAPGEPEVKSAAVLLGKANAAHATTQVITRSGAGLKGQTFANASAGVIGMDASTEKGGHGVYGHSVHGDGVLGISAKGNGVVGQGSTPGMAAVKAVDANQGGGAYGIFAQSVHGTAIWATSGQGTALKVDGKARFSHSGVVSIPAGHKAMTFSKPGISDGDVILATIQRPQSGVSIEGAQASNGSFTITLSKAPASAISIGWLQLG